MAVPNFLRSSYYSRHAVTVDNDTALDEIFTALSGQVPAWTITDNRGAAPANLVCTSPVDADGRFFRVTITAVAASSNLKMEYVVTDQAGTTVCTRRTGTTVTTNLWDIYIFSGEYHLAIDFFYNSATAESFRAGITDFSPEAQSGNSHYVYGNATKSNADAAGTNTAEYTAMIDNATANISTRANLGGGTATSAYGLQTESGFRRYIPIDYWCRPTGEASNYYWSGRGYQQLIVPAGTIGGTLPQRAKVTVPIDIGSTGVFQVCACPTAAGRRIAYRVA